MLNTPVSLDWAELHGMLTVMVEFGRASENL